MMAEPQKGDRVGDGVLAYVGRPSLQGHECNPPEAIAGIPVGSVWWCLDCDWQWVKERSGAWGKWRKAAL